MLCLLCMLCLQMDDNLVDMIARRMTTVPVATPLTLPSAAERYSDPGLGMSIEELDPDSLFKLITTASQE